MDHALYCNDQTAIFKVVHIDNIADTRKRRHFAPTLCSVDGELYKMHQYTRALGSIYLMSSVSVYSCTGR